MDLEASEQQENRMLIKDEIAIHTKQVEEILMQYLPESDGFQKTVIEALRYSFLAGGKRLRPMLMQETYRLFHGESRVIEPFMAAMEMIHTYSLIHDDLPAMDNDDYRRGKKTTHVVYGEAIAILAGDGLLNLAFETALKAFDIEPENAGIPKALQILAKHAGIYGMIGGQTVDVESEGQPLEQDKLDFIYELKTGALIEASMLIGAVLAGAGEMEQRSISDAAKEIGLAFQIQDDILDVTGDEQTIGKPVGSDAKNEKTTYVTVRGLEQSAKDVEELSNHAIQTITSLEAKNEYLIRLLKSMINRDR